MGGVAVTAPSTATFLADRGRRGGREESDDAVETEVRPIVGRGVAHTLLRRDVTDSGAGIDEVVRVDAGSVGQSPSVPSSPSEPSSPVNNSSDRAAPPVSSPAPETDGEGQGGQEAGKVEMGNPGGDDEVESIAPGGHDVESIMSGGPVEAEAPPPAARRSRHVDELADFNTPARVNDEVRNVELARKPVQLSSRAYPALWPP